MKMGRLTACDSYKFKISVQWEKEKKRIKMKQKALCKLFVCQTNG